MLGVSAAGDRSLLLSWVRGGEGRGGEWWAQREGSSSQPAHELAPGLPSPHTSSCCIFQPKQKVWRKNGFVASCVFSAVERLPAWWSIARLFFFSPVRGMSACPFHRHVRICAAIYFLSRPSFPFLPPAFCRPCRSPQFSPLIPSSMPGELIPMGRRDSDA